LTGSSTLAWDADGTPPLHAHSDGANDDILVMKQITAAPTSGTPLRHHDGWDYGNEIVVAPDDWVYIAGSSGDGWLGDGEAAPLHAYSGGDDITLLRLDPDGAYQWHTFYGSYDYEYAAGLAIDSANRITLGGAALF
jgi:hypothetical protein